MDADFNTLWLMANQFYEAVDATGKLIFDEVPGEEDSFRVPLASRQILISKEYIKGSDNSDLEQWTIIGEYWKCVYIFDDPFDGEMRLDLSFDGDRDAFTRDIIEAKLMYC